MSFEKKIIYQNEYISIFFSLFLYVTGARLFAWHYRKKTCRISNKTKTLKIFKQYLLEWIINLLIE